jgi:hypothetical protein
VRACVQVQVGSQMLLGRVRSIVLRMLAFSRYAVLDVASEAFLAQPAWPISSPSPGSLAIAATCAVSSGLVSSTVFLFSISIFLSSIHVDPNLSAIHPSDPICTWHHAPDNLHCVRTAPHTAPRTPDLLDDQASHPGRKKTASHLSELVGRSTGDLGDPQGSQLGLEFIELGEEVGLVPTESRWLFVKVDKKGEW